MCPDFSQLSSAPCSPGKPAQLMRLTEALLPGAAAENRRRVKVELGDPPEEGSGEGHHCSVQASGPREVAAAPGTATVTRDHRHWRPQPSQRALRETHDPGLPSLAAPPVLLATHLGWWAEGKEPPGWETEWGWVQGTLLCSAVPRDAHILTPDL